MRFLVIGVFGLAALYAGYWVVGAGAATGTVTRLLQQAEADGLDVAYSQIDTVGFPSRFDTTLTDLRLADPARDLGWNAPFFQLFALSYRPNHLIAVWPDRQEIVLPGSRLTLTSDSLRGSVRARPAASLPLAEATLEGRALALASDAGWAVDVTSVLAATRAVSGDAVAPNSYDVFVDATGIALPMLLLEALGGAGAVPAVAERLRLDARIALTAPLDRFAPRAMPGLTALSLRDLTFYWGDAKVTGTGDLTVDATGQPEGRIVLSVSGWAQLIDIALASGAIGAGQADTISRAASALADGAGRLEASIIFRNGFVSLGPLPIGPAPRLR